MSSLDFKQIFLMVLIISLVINKIMDNTNESNRDKALNGNGIKGSANHRIGELAAECKNTSEICIDHESCCLKFCYPISWAANSIHKCA